MTTWENRWDDPVWLAAWTRRGKAVLAWNKVWPDLDFRQYGSVYKPTPDKIVDEQLRAIAQEYLDSQSAYIAICNSYPTEEAEEVVR